MTLFVYIFIEYFDFVCLDFHYNQCKEANFSLAILETRLSVFVQPLVNLLWRVRILMTFVSLTVHCKNFVVNQK